MRAALAVTPLAAVLLCTACPREPELVEADYCEAQMPADTSMLPQRELKLGELVDGSFVPWADGQEVEFVYGVQGFPMLIPWFELPAEAADTDSACWHLLYEHIDANGNSEYANYDAGLVFMRGGDVMRSDGPLFDIAPGGPTLSLRATVSSPDFVAVSEISIVLVN